MRDLKCKIINNKKNFFDKFLFYYRYLVFFNSMSRFENYLTKKGFLKIIKVGEGDVMLIESDNIFNNGYKLLDKDIFF